MLHSLDIHSHQYLTRIWNSSWQASWLFTVMIFKTHRAFTWEKMTLRFLILTMKVLDFNWIQPTSKIHETWIVYLLKIWVTSSVSILGLERNSISLSEYSSIGVLESKVRNWSRHFYSFLATHKWESRTAWLQIQEQVQACQTNMHSVFTLSILHDQNQRSNTIPQAASQSHTFKSNGIFYDNICT